jgi:hypothetical protein
MPLVVEPLCCAQCAWLSTRHCPHLKRRIDEGAIVIRQVFKFEIIAQQLNAEATLEFCGVNIRRSKDGRGFLAEIRAGCRTVRTQER